MGQAAAAVDRAGRAPPLRATASASSSSSTAHASSSPSSDREQQLSSTPSEPAAGRFASRVPLNGAICVRCAAGVAYGRRPYAFVVQTRSRDHYFAVSSIEEVENWVETITDAIAALEGTAEPHHSLFGHADHQFDRVERVERVLPLSARPSRTSPGGTSGASPAGSGGTQTARGAPQRLRPVTAKTAAGFGGGGLSRRY